MATEFTVLLEDRPGALAALSEALAKSAINIVAIHATPCPNQGIVQFVTNNNDATVEALRDSEFEYTTNEVLVLPLSHEPGALARLSGALGNAGININALYITMSGQLVLDTGDFKAAQRVALDLGLR
jgi:hypothetical protein